MLPKIGATKKQPLSLLGNGGYLLFIATINNNVTISIMMIISMSNTSFRREANRIPNRQHHNELLREFIFKLYQANVALSINF